MILEKAFGIIPLKQTKNGWQVFLVKKKEGHTGFPKGHALQNEDPKKTAERELFEETGLKITQYLSNQTLIEIYTLEREGRKFLKTVAYYLAEVEGEIILEEAEIIEGRWVNLKEAVEHITFAEGRVLASKIECLLPKA